MTPEDLMVIGEATPETLTMKEEDTTGEEEAKGTATGEIITLIRGDRAGETEDIAIRWL